MEIANTTNRSNNFTSNNYSRTYNVPPTHNLSCIVHKSCQIETSHQEQNEDFVKEDLTKVELPNCSEIRKVVVFKWGWIGSYVINARGEELRDKPMFKNHLNPHRCVIVVEGAFEWTPEKEPYKFVSKTKDHLLIAGLFNSQGEVLLLTMEANEYLGKIHHRMPVLLNDDMVDKWIDPKVPFWEVESFIVDRLPSVYDDIEAIKISKLVSSLKNKGKDVILSEVEMIEKNKKKGLNLDSFFSKAVKNTGQITEKGFSDNFKAKMGASSSAGIEIDPVKIISSSKSEAKTQVPTQANTESKPFISSSKAVKQKKDFVSAKVHTAKRYDPL